METVQSQESQTQTQSDSYQNPIHPYFSIGGVRINAVTLAQTIQLMDDWIKHRHKNYIVLGLLKSCIKCAIYALLFIKVCGLD